MSKKFSLHHFCVGGDSQSTGSQINGALEEYLRSLGHSLVSDNLVQSYWAVHPDKVGYRLLEGKMEMYCPLISNTASDILNVVPDAVDNWIQKSEKENDNFIVPPRYSTMFSSMIHASLIHHYIPYYDQELGIRRVQSEFQLWYNHTYIQ